MSNNTPRRRDVANIQNDGNERGHYPLFLGADLGFSDSINVTYPELEALYEVQMGQFWRETEFSLTQDKADLRTCDKSSRDIMIFNLMSQWLMDSVASRSIMSLLEPFTSNNELMKVLSAWSLFENIHAASYSLIIRQCFDNPNDVIEDAKKNIAVMYRSNLIRKIFNETSRMSAEYSLDKDSIPLRDLKKQLLKTVYALYTLEAVSFMASFACTFALTETGKFQGIGNQITSICRDEILHAKFGKAIQNILLTREGYREIFDECADEIREIFDECILQEYSFSDYIFSDGRSVLGLNNEMLRSYTRYCAAPMYQSAGFEWDTERFGAVPDKNPLPYMDKYVKPDTIQAAAQETEIVSYRVAQVESDVGSDEFDFDI